MAEFDIFVKLLEFGTAGLFIMAGLFIIWLLRPTFAEHLRQQREILEKIDTAIAGQTEAMHAHVNAIQRVDVRMGMVERRLGMLRPEYMQMTNVPPHDDEDDCKSVKEQTDGIQKRAIRQSQRSPQAGDESERDVEGTA